MKTYLTIILGLVVALSISRCQLEKIIEDRDRLAGNQSALLENLRTYETKNGLYASEVSGLTLSLREFKDKCSDLQTKVKDLNLDVKRLKSINQTGVSTDFEITAPVVIIPPVDPVNPPVLTITYSDPYFDLSGVIVSGSFRGKISSRDTLIQTISRVPHRWWFIKWGTKGIKQNIQFSNPNAKVAFAKYIDLE